MSSKGCVLLSLAHKTRPDLFGDIYYGLGEREKDVQIFRLHFRVAICRLRLLIQSMPE